MALDDQAEEIVFHVGVFKDNANSPLSKTARLELDVNAETRRKRETIFCPFPLLDAVAYEGNPQDRAASLPLSQL